MASDVPTPPPPHIDPPPEYLRRGHIDDDIIEKTAGASAGARKAGIVFLATITIAVFSVALWFAYDQGVRRGVQMAPPLIKADAGPTKIAPDEPGGMAVPHQDKTVYDRLSGKTETVEAEKLLPPPETVVEKPLAIIQDAKPEAGTDPVPKPPKVESLPITPPAEEPKEQTAAKPEPKAAPEPPAAPKAEVKPETEAKPAATPASVAPKKPEPAPKVTAKADPKSLTPDALQSGYLIQVGAYRSPARARSGWQSLVKANTSLLGSLTPLVVRADLGARGVYHRLRAGPVDGPEAAKALCDRLKQRKVACLVIKP